MNANTNEAIEVKAEDAAMCLPYSFRQTNANIEMWRNKCEKHGRIRKNCKTCANGYWEVCETDFIDKVRELKIERIVENDLLLLEISDVFPVKIIDYANYLFQTFCPTCRKFKLLISTSLGRTFCGKCRINVSVKTISNRVKTLSI